MLDLLALILLSLPPDTPTPPLPPFLTDRIRTVAIRWQLMDQRDSQMDLWTLRFRARDLAGAPPIEDAARWPTLATAQAACCFNRKYVEHVRARLSIDPWRWQEVDDFAQACCWSYKVWDAVWDARTDGELTSRRKALARLRELLGAEAYAAGRLPMAVGESTSICTPSCLPVPE